MRRPIRRRSFRRHQGGRSHEPEFVSPESAAAVQRAGRGLPGSGRKGHHDGASRTEPERNWCFDFGGLKPVRAWLHEQFDHTLIVAEDDPDLSTFRRLERDGLAAVRILPAVGCESVAKYVFDHMADNVGRETGARVWLESVEVREHGGNSAIYQR